MDASYKPTIRVLSLAERVALTLEQRPRRYCYDRVVSLALFDQDIADSRANVHGRASGPILR